jgi:uncharacterized 2Fe-2S/4Fe-4S cluster protein (DUF4445 family)
MAVTLTINGQSIEATDPRSLFDYAEAMGIDVPTSCRKQGKCKECMVEVVEGMSALSAPTPPESHLRGNFRLSCQAHVTAAEGRVRCHTMRRGHMRIERHAFGLPIANRDFKPDPAVTRDGDRILIEGIENERATGPLLGITMDLGTTTIVLRLVDLETGELIADTSFENPQRFGGSEVMSRIAYDTDHPGRLLMHARRLSQPRHRKAPRRSEDHLRNGRRRQLDHARSLLPPERLFHRPDALPLHHRN